MQNRVALNAAIEHLISGDSEKWLKSAKMILQFAIDLPVSGPRVIHETLTFYGTRETVSRYTVDHGDVRFDHNEIKKVEEHTIGQKVSRVGYYKIWRVDYCSSKPYIAFQNSQQMAPSVSPDEEFHFEHWLFYDPKSYEPLTLAVAEWRQINKGLMFRLYKIVASIRHATLWIRFLRQGVPKISYQIRTSRVFAIRVIHTVEKNIKHGENIIDR